MELKSNPGRLRERIRELNTRFIIIDEVQKVPELMDEIHYLIEKEHIVFGLCGSNARKDHVPIFLGDVRLDLNFWA